MIGCGVSGNGLGGGSNSALSGGNCKVNGTGLESTGITESHNHMIQLTAAQIAAADPSAIFVTSDVGHTHPVQLTPAQYASLQTNQGVNLNTGPGPDGHVHAVTFNCA